ncbi:hypothetical protein NL676_016507 [Syzygium grande]|nr:hypothetical protein NL676_016507 [Syzygium grande]
MSPRGATPSPSSATTLASSSPSSSPSFPTSFPASPLTSLVSFANPSIDFLHLPSVSLPFSLLRLRWLLDNPVMYFEYARLNNPNLHQALSRAALLPRGCHGSPKPSSPTSTTALLPRSPPCSASPHTITTT